MKEIRLLLFDLDDTLLYFDDYWKRSLYEAFETFPLTKDIGMDRLFPVFLEQDEWFHEQWLEGTIDGKEFRRLRFVHTLAAFGVSAGAEEAEAFERWFWTVRAPYIPHDRILIERLERWGQTYKLAMLTNGTAEDQYDKLHRMGLGLLFSKDNVFISDELGVAKPNPEAYLKAAERMGVRPDQTLFVGDSWTNDVAGPIRAGMTAVWLNRKGLETPPEPVPSAVIGHLEELEFLLFAKGGR
ncbi:HAD family hydrolase [Paenibacillus tarimensis]